MAERLPWFPCFQSKLLGALAGMSPDCGYIYTIVLLRTYEVAGACPDSSAVLSRRSGVGVKRVDRAIDWLVEKGKLTLTEAGLVNPYAAEVLELRDSVRKRLQKAGKAGGEKSAEKRKQNQSNVPSQAAAPAKPPPSILDLDTDTDSESKKKKDSPAVAVEDDYPSDGFDRFWSLYPPGRKGAKKATHTKFDAIRRRKEVTFERLMAGLQRFVDSRPDPQYTKGPEVWLNKGCWDDEYLKGGPPNEKTRTPDSKLGFAGIAARARYGAAGPERPAPEDLEPVNGRRHP